MTSLALATVVQLSVLAAPPQGFQQAYQRSMESGQPLVVLLGAEWCPACKQMDGKILPEVAKRGGFKGVEYAYIDVDQDRKLAGKLAQGGSIPQLIRFEKTNEGWESDYLIGAQSVQKVTNFVRGSPEFSLSSWLKPAAAD